MKIKDLIAELQKLDQEKQLVVIYDGISAFDPLPDSTLSKREAKFFADEGLNEGDYIITAG